MNLEEWLTLPVPDSHDMRRVVVAYESQEREVVRVRAATEDSVVFSRGSPVSVGDMHWLSLVYHFVES